MSVSTRPEGCLNVSEIATGMGYSRQWVNDRLKLVVPFERTANRTWYKLSDVVPALQRDGQSEGGTDIDELPPRERKEYFLSLKEEQNFKERNRQLIPVDKFEQVLADAFKTLASSLESLPDFIDRSMELSPEQFETLIKLVDGARADLYSNLVSSVQQQGDEDEI